MSEVVPWPRNRGFLPRHGSGLFWFAVLSGVRFCRHVGGDLQPRGSRTPGLRRKKLRLAPFPPLCGENCAHCVPSSSPHATRCAGLARGPLFYFLCGQKVTKEPLKGRLKRSTASASLRRDTAIRLTLKNPGGTVSSCLCIRYLSALSLYPVLILLPVPPRCFR